MLSVPCVMCRWPPLISTSAAKDRYPHELRPSPPWQGCFSVGHPACFCFRPRGLSPVPPEPSQLLCQSSPGQERRCPSGSPTSRTTMYAHLCVTWARVFSSSFTDHKERQYEAIVIYGEEPTGLEKAELSARATYLSLLDLRELEILVYS